MLAHLYQRMHGPDEIVRFLAQVCERFPDQKMMHLMASLRDTAADWPRFLKRLPAALFS